MSTPEYTLKDIRDHPKFPFRDWREDDLSFLMLELYWAELVRTTLGKEMAQYVPLFDTDRDGNPILTVTNISAARGLRLVLLENDDGKPKYPEATGPDAFYALYAYLNKGRLPDGETPIDELVMLVQIDEQYLPHFVALLLRHCCDYTPLDEMEKLIVGYEQELSMGDPETDLSDD